MRVFLTGATGYIGSAVLDALLRAGHRVTALVRDPDKARRLGEKGVAVIVADLGAPEAYLAALEDADAVVHAAMEASPRGVALEREVLETVLPSLARWARISPRAFVYTSGCWLLGRTVAPADETAPVNPVDLVAWRPAHEQIVLGAAGDGLRTLVVRPGIVYGGGRGIVADLIRDALNGLVRVVGPGRNHWALVYDRDLADLYVRLLAHPEARGVYHATDEADERVNDIVEAIAAQVPQRPDVRHVPMAEARKKLGRYADALALDQRLRSPRARALGWSPTLRSVAGNAARLVEEYRAAAEDA